VISAEPYGLTRKGDRQRSSDRDPVSRELCQEGRLPMRSLLLTLGLIVCCVLLAAIACTESTVKPDDPIEYVTWETTWGGPDDEYPRCALAVEGGVIVAGRTPGDVCAVKFDAETGCTVWEMFHGTPLPDNIRDIAATPDGGAVLAGYSGWTDAMDILDSYFIKITSEGEVEWEGRYSGARGKSEAFCITVTSDGTPFVAGLSRTGPQIPVQPAEEYIIKLDPANGEVIKELDIGSLIADAEVWDMIAVDVPEPGLVLVGRRGMVPYIAKVDQELDTVLWEKTPEVERAKLYEVTATHDRSGYVAAGALDDFTKACLIGFDLEGNMIWSNVFGHSDSTESHARGVASLPDGYVVVGSITYAYIPEDVGDVYLVKTNLQGEVVRDTTYGHPNSVEQGEAIEVAPDGGCYVAAIFRDKPMGNPDFYVIRTDPNGGQ